MNFRENINWTCHWRFIKRTNQPKSGYALLLVLFFLTLLAVTLGVAAPDLFIRARREKEDEMVWRGKQYERGIKLFYRKNHRIPNSLDDLTGLKFGMRFMRRAYKDPMNGTDGSWRLIYVGPAGQLIGSTRPDAIFRLGVPSGPPGDSQTVSAIQNSRNAFDLQSNGSGIGIQSLRSGPGPQNGGNDFSATDAAGTAATGSGLAGPGAQIVGAGIIGVGSKIDRSSVRWLDGAKNYLQFEFIWDPSKEGMGVNPVKLLSAPAADAGQQPQTSPLGQPSAGRTDSPASSTPE